MLAVGSGNAVLTLMRGSGSAAGFAFWLRGGKAHIFCAYFSSLAVQNPRFWPCGLAPRFRLAAVALLFRQCGLALRFRIRSSGSAVRLRCGFAVPNPQFWLAIVGR